MKIKAIVLSAMLMLSVVGVTSAASDPGSGEDPLVAQSYVDAKFSAMETRIKSLEDKVAALEARPSGGAAAAVYQVVFVPAGKTVVCGASTEVILRSGKATAIASESGGVADLQAGKDLKTGETVVANHLLLIPKADNRGILVSGDAYVMIKGDYTLK